MITVTDSMLPLKHDTVITIGNFDGLHRGHQILINEVLRLASELSLVPAVWTFSSCADELRKKKGGLIFDDKEKASVLTSLGVGAVYFADFEKYRNMEPETFVKKVLCGDFGAKAVVCGYDFRFGAKARGDADFLRKSLPEMGIKCIVVPPLKIDGTIVSSTEIRKKIADGDAETAAVLLGRPYGFAMPVIHGRENGRRLGFRTLNQIYPQDHILPRFGVYAACCYIDGKQYNGVANVGIRPTVREEKNEILCETHLFDFDGDVYGKTVRTELIKMIRGEKRFDDFSQLKAQISDDVLCAKEFFAISQK